MKRIFLFLLVALAVFSCGKKEESVLYVNGRIECDEYDVGNKYPGKVEKVFVKEGDFVKKGQVLALLDSKELKAQLEGARALLRSSESVVEAKRKELSSLREKIKSLKEKLKELKASVPEEIKAAENRVKECQLAVKQAEFSLSSVRSTLNKARKDYKRFKALYERRVISKDKFEKVELNYKQLLDKEKTAVAEVKKAKENLQIARRELKIVTEKWKEVSSLEHEIASLKESAKALNSTVSAFREKAHQARAEVKRLTAVLKDMEIRSPIDGIVMEKMVEPGEVIPAGYRLFTLYNPDDVYFEGYVPESKVGFLSLGQKGYLKVDAYPNRKFPVRLTYVSSRAEFTPKEVQTKEERVKEVFKVKLRPLKNPHHLLKPGMPADCYIYLR